MAPGRACLPHQFDTYLEWVHIGRVRHLRPVPYTAVRGPEGERGVPRGQHQVVTPLIGGAQDLHLACRPCWALILVTCELS